MSTYSGCPIGQCCLFLVLRSLFFLFFFSLHIINWPVFFSLLFFHLLLLLLNMCEWASQCKSMAAIVPLLRDRLSSIARWRRWCRWLRISMHGENSKQMEGGSVEFIARLSKGSHRSHIFERRLWNIGTSTLGLGCYENVCQQRILLLVNTIGWISWGKYIPRFQKNILIPYDACM